MPETIRNRVFSDGTSNYVKPMTNSEVQPWLDANAGHTLVR